MSKEHPTSIQMLKDLKSVGCSSILVNQLLDELQNDTKKLNVIIALSHHSPRCWTQPRRREGGGPVVGTSSGG